MNALVALLIALVPQDEARLKESWPKLVDAWKAVEAYKPPTESAVLDDEYLKVVAKIHGAFEASGLFASDGEYGPQALKAFVKLRVRDLTGLMGINGGQWWQARRVRVVFAGGEQRSATDRDPMATLMESLKKLQAMKESGLDDEDNVQDEVVTARKALKSLGITADDTPPALRRRVMRLVRALATGEAYPEAPAPTEEQARQVRAWIGELGHESIEIREKAMKELMRAGEPALPLLREALKNPDAEVASRVRKALGVGHEPWKAAKPEGTFFDELRVAPAAPAR